MVKNFYFLSMPCIVRVKQQQQQQQVFHIANYACSCIVSMLHTLHTALLCLIRTVPAASSARGGKNRRRGKKDGDLPVKRELEYAEEGQCTCPRTEDPGAA